MVDLTPPPGELRLGIDIGGTKLLVAAFTSTGRRHWTFPTGPGASPAMLDDHVASVLLELGATKPNAIGFAAPALVDSRGVVRESDVLPKLGGWRPASDWPGAAVLNDGEAALVSVAAGEAEQATIAAIGCGTGVVAAFQLAGVRLRTFRPYGGELRFAPCGRAGTFDELASGAAILRTLGMEAKQVQAQLERGDARAVAVVREAGEAFGLALATVLQLVHPEKIGVYGGTLRYRGYWDAAMEALRRVAHPLMLPLCRVELLPDSEFVVAAGALRFALSQQERHA